MTLLRDRPSMDSEFGFRVHALVAWPGVIVGFAIAAADVPLDSFCQRARGQAVERVVKRASARGQEAGFGDIAAAISELSVSVHRDTLSGLIGHAVSAVDLSEAEPSITVFDLSEFHVERDEFFGLPTRPTYVRMAALSCLEAVFHQANTASSFARRQLVIDGFESLTRHPASCIALLNLAKRARIAGLSVILVGQSLGPLRIHQSIARNSRSALLFRQSPQSVGQIARMGMVPIERLSSLYDFRLGEAMRIRGEDISTVQVSPTEEEYAVCEVGSL